MLRPKRREREIPYARPDDVNKRGMRVYILDSGASSNVIKQHDCTGALRRFVRQIINPINYDTAKGSITAAKGLRMQIAPWDVPCEVVIMQDCPDLVSMGERCMEGGFSYIWVHGKFPCFISPDSTYIIIFDVKNNLPIYSPDFEHSDDMLSAFEFDHA